MKLYQILLLFILCFSCKEYETDFIPDNEYRIVKITENNVENYEVNIHYFAYDNRGKLYEWKKYFINENNELQELRKLNFSYTGNVIETTIFNKKNNEWEKHQLFKFTVEGDHIVEKLITHYSPRECEQCWKYKYRYLNSNLIETTKFGKNNSGIWEILEKNTYSYKNNYLIKYQYFYATNDGNLILDYSRDYTIESGICTCWKGGTIIDNTDWAPTQKIEFEYAQGKLSSETYSIRSNTNSEWQIFGSINYFYDWNNYLIERLTSRGNSIRYEYEKGKGNLELFLDWPYETVKPGIVTL